MTLVDGAAAEAAGSATGQVGVSLAIKAEDLLRRFAYHAPDRARAELHEDVRAGIYSLARWLNETLPTGREASLVITHLEEAMFWANAAIARADKEA